MRVKTTLKRLLEPHPSIFNLLRRIHRFFYQLLDRIRHRVLMPLWNSAYRARYREHWEWAGSVSLEQDLASGYLEPGGRSERQAEFLIEQIASLSPDSVLEFGCGYGRLLRPLSLELPHLLLAGYDISSTKLANARTYLGERNVPLVMGDGRFGLPFRDDSFDLVYTWGVLMHIPPPMDQEVRKELSRVAKNYILHIEGTRAGMRKFGHDNASRYGELGLLVEKREFTPEQTYGNPIQFIVVKNIIAGQPS